jgi:hypothetical protein
VTSIDWYFRRNVELLDAVTDRALKRYDFTEPSIDAPSRSAQMSSAMMFAPRRRGSA